VGIELFDNEGRSGTRGCSPEGERSGVVVEASRAPWETGVREGRFGFVLGPGPSWSAGSFALSGGCAEAPGVEHGEGTGQARKGARWMPGRGQARKDVASCEKPRGAARGL